MTKVTVIIPVYNVEKYIEQGLNSLINQTLEDIEIICIDDASSDGSLQILREFEAADSRVKIIAYDTNKTASQARKDGVMLADSEYIMFMDGDDYYELNACEELYDEIKKQNVDMLQFGTNIINVGAAPETRIKNVEGLLAPYVGKLIGDEVFEGCFIDKKYRFSLWNKIYKTTLCKQAFSYIQDGSYPKAQDLYAFFILAYFAKSYVGIENKGYYNYLFGAGITGNSSIDLAQMKRYCTSSAVAKGIEQFVEAVGAVDKYGEVAKDIRADLLNDCIANWFNYLPSSYSAKGFDELLKSWTNTEVIAKICAKYYRKKQQIAQMVRGSEAIKVKTRKEVKTIGIFYYRFSLGGVQRVLTLLIPMYIKMGYEVVLFIEEESDDDYQLPKGAKKVILPPLLGVSFKSYEERAQALERELLDNNIDVLLYHAGSSPKILFEMLVTKLTGVPVVVTIHETVFQAMLGMNPELATRPASLRIADEVVVLSKMDEQYWRLLDINAKYIPNPLPSFEVTRDATTIEKNCIVWVGRLDFRTKKCMDLISVMAKVAQQIPDAKLLVVGNEVSNNAVESMEAEIEKLGMQDNVILCGGTNDINQYYDKAEVCLLTSASETFPMVIAESKEQGIPLVMYEIPQLEMVQKELGMICVPQGDTKEMADAVVSLLKDDEYRKRMGKEAKESLDEFKEYDLTGEWKQLLDEICINSNDNIDGINLDEKSLKVMLESMLLHYGMGSTNKQKELKTLKKELSKALKAKETITFKLGVIILAVPRKILRLFKKVKKKMF